MTGSLRPAMAKFALMSTEEWFSESSPPETYELRWNQSFYGRPDKIMVLFIFKAIEGHNKQRILFSCLADWLSQNILLVSEDLHV